jgi:hypothetical protein
LFACDAGKAFACVTSDGMATGTHVFTGLPPSRYHLIVDADKPGKEGRGAPAVGRRVGDAIAAVAEARSGGRSDRPVRPANAGEARSHHSSHLAAE